MEYYCTQTLHGTAIFAYIGVVSGVNVGIWHGVSGLYSSSEFNSDCFCEGANPEAFKGRMNGTWYPQPF